MWEHTYQVLVGLGYIWRSCRRWRGWDHSGYFGRESEMRAVNITAVLVAGLLCGWAATRLGLDPPEPLGPLTFEDPAKTLVSSAVAIVGIRPERVPAPDVGSDQKIQERDRARPSGNASEGEKPDRTAPPTQETTVEETPPAEPESGTGSGGTAGGSDISSGTSGASSGGASSGGASSGGGAGTGDTGGGAGTGGGTSGGGGGGATGGGGGGG
jgi:uncharacterized membrane protein YgcG